MKPSSNTSRVAVDTYKVKQEKVQQKKEEARLLSFNLTLLYVNTIARKLFYSGLHFLGRTKIYGCFI